MKNQILNIAATAVLTLAIVSPFAMHADRSTAMQGFEIEVDNLTNQDNYYNQANEFTTLDDEAVRELADMGIDAVDETDTYNSQLAEDIIAYAKKYLGRPYRHGAKGPSSFDCSGFTSYVFKQYGITLSPSSKMQATQGEKINTDEVRPGDLLFFGGRSGGSTVGHVAMAVDVDDNGTITFIHAATSKGISYSKYPDGGYYSKRYLGARRVITD